MSANDPRRDPSDERASRGLWTNPSRRDFRLVPVAEPAAAVDGRTLVPVPPGTYVPGPDDFALLESDEAVAHAGEWLLVRDGHIVRAHREVHRLMEGIPPPERCQYLLLFKEDRPVPGGVVHLP